jgi:hypothetical protein
MDACKLQHGGRTRPDLAVIAAPAAMQWSLNQT